MESVGEARASGVKLMAARTNGKSFSATQMWQEDHCIDRWISFRFEVFTEEDSALTLPFGIGSPHAS